MLNSSATLSFADLLLVSIFIILDVNKTLNILLKISKLACNSPT